MSEWNVVTGATGYTGKYITKRLLTLGEKVKSLTGHPERSHPFGAQVQFLPFHFDDPSTLTKQLRGTKVLYNTYWVRFQRGAITFESAVDNTRVLLRAAKAAGVQRVIHISVTNPEEGSLLAYYRGKVATEQVVRESGLPYAIVRPTLIFGDEDILVHNIVWCLRRFPIFAIPGAGDYRVQPVFVEDVAELAVMVGQAKDNLVVDSAGPEILTFEELVRLLVQQIGSRVKIVHAPPSVALACAALIGQMKGDVLLTREELDGLMANLLVSRQAPQGRTRFSEWLAISADRLGVTYAHELKRHFY